MKKVVLALAMTAVSIQTSGVEGEIYKDDSTNVILFGEIRTRFSKVMHGDETASKRDEKVRFSMNSSHLGVRGTHKLGDTADALGYISLCYDDDEASSKGNRFNVDESWMGIATGFGTFKVGRTGSIQDDDMSFYDVTSEFGRRISPHHLLTGTGVQDGVLEYGWNNDNFSVRIQYFAAATKVDFPGFASADLDRGFAMGGAWTADFGLGLHLAYTGARADDLVRTGPSLYPIAPLAVLSFDQQTLSYGVSFTFAGLSLAAVASDITYMPKEKGSGATLAKEKEKDLGLSARYLFDFGLGAYVVYEKSTQKDFTGSFASGLANIDSNQYIGGIEYRLLEKLLSFAELSQVKTKGVKRATLAWAVGTRFDF